jgi:hypothetical protein
MRSANCEMWIPLASMYSAVYEIHEASGRHGYGLDENMNTNSKVKRDMRDRWEKLEDVCQTYTYIQGIKTIASRRCYEATDAYSMRL